MRMSIVRCRSLAVAVTSFAVWLGCGSEVGNGVGGTPSSGGGLADGGSPPWGGSPAHGGTGGVPTGGMEAAGGGSGPTGGMGTGGMGTGGMGTGGSAMGGAGTGGIGSGGMGAGGGAVAICESAQPIVIDGTDTGIDFCAQGTLWRREVVTCPDVVPDYAGCAGCSEGEVCEVLSAFNSFCVPGCLSDADCGPNKLCLCRESGSFCVAASCWGPDDCEPGQACTAYDPWPGCGYVAFACTTPQDTCVGQYDCPSSHCVRKPDGHRKCEVANCPL